MIIGLLSGELFIQGSSSLKAKRQVLKGLKDRLRRRFNISLAEINNQDKWQRAALGIAYVGSDKASVNSALDKVLNYIESDGNTDLGRYEIEIL